MTSIDENKVSGSSEARFIRPTTVMKCAKCLNSARIPAAITNDNVPCVVMCPQCHLLTEWKVVPILPKCQPQPDLPNYWLYEGVTLQEVQEFFIKRDSNVTEAERSDPRRNTPENSGEEANDTANPPVPFFVRAKELGETTNSLFQQAQGLQNEITKFSNTIGKYFQSQAQLADKFSSQWRPEYLQEFLEFPFVSCRLDCENELAGRYARMILAPKFFDPSLGVKVAGRGGFRLEIVNQYSRINFPLTEETAKILEVPQSLDLKVVGNKIIGSSVQLCWKDIAGTVEDLDSTEMVRSIFIKNKSAARLWLAQHGVAAVPERKVGETDLSCQTLEMNIRDTPGYMQVWKQFVSTGRVGIFWASAMAARRMAVLIAYMIRGVVPVFVVSEYDRAAWSSLYTTCGAAEGEEQRGFKVRNDTVYCVNGDYVEWGTVMRARLIVVDMHSARLDEDGNVEELDSAVLEKLLEYDGMLVVIGPDPMLDFNRENWRAAHVHALAPWQFYEPAQWEKWGGKKVGVDYLREVMRRSI